MQCFRCHEEVDIADFVEIIRFTKEEGTTLAAFHPACYAEIVTYLEENYKDWEDAIQSQAHSRQAVPTTTEKDGPDAR